MAEATQELLEKTLDTIEDTLDVMESGIDTANHKTFALLKNPKIVLGATVVVTVAATATATYLVASKILRKKYQAQADAEIQDVKDTYLAVTKQGISLEEMAAHIPDDAILVVDREELITKRTEVEEVITENGYAQYDKVPPAEEVPIEDITVTQAIIEATTRNIFESDDPDTYFDFREEIERREQKPNDPYVITKEEFDLNETDFSQTSLTYYDGDDVLCDEKDTPIEDVDRVIGVQNLLRFGHGSGDPRIVYIRNARLNLDLEVAHSDGKFAKEVLGFDDGELKHSQQRPIRRMRPDRE